MSLLRKLFLLSLAFVASVMFANAVYAVTPDAAEVLQERMRLLDRTFNTPPSISLDQRRLQIAALSAVGAELTDPALIMQAYLEAGQLVTYYLHAETTYAWNGSEWTISYRTLYTYVDGNQTESHEQDWNGSEWVSSGKTTSTYDGSDRLATMEFIYWDTDSSAWINFFRFEYSYTGGGLLSEVIQYNWGGGMWRPSTKGIATYSGTTLTQMLEQSYTGTVWQDSRRTLYSYNGSDQITEILTQNYTGSWVNALRTTNTYSGGNLTQTINESWDGNNWIHTRRYDYQYDGSNNQTHEQGYNWVSDDWSLTDSDTMKYSGNQLVEEVNVNIGPIINSVTRTTYEYDGAGNLIEDILYFDFFGTLQPGTRTTYYYSTSGIFDNDASAGAPADFDIGQNYPNPFNMNTVIPYSLTGDSHVKITVCNILGQTVSTLVDAFQPAGAHNALWNGQDANGRDAASGIYFTRVQAGAHTQVRKMVLLK